MSMLWEKKVMVRLPTGLMARLMPELPKAHCQLMLRWTGGGAGGYEAQLGYVAQLPYRSPHSRHARPVTPSARTSPQPGSEC